MYHKGLFIVSFLVFSLFACAFVSAVSVTLTEVNSTLATVSVANAVNMYAYEVNLVFSDTVTRLNHAQFLGSTAVATYGYSTRGTALKVYGSRLDSTQTGITGSGELFNVTHTGTLDLSSLVAVDSGGSDETVSYSSSSSSSGSSSGGGGGGGGSGGVVNVSSTVTVSVGNLTLTVISRRLAKYNVTLVNSGSAPIEITLISQGFGGVLTVPPRITLNPGEPYMLQLIFEPVERGLVTGTLSFKAGNSIIHSIPVTLNARSDNFLFDVALSLADRYRIMASGEKLRTQVNLQEVGTGTEQLDVVANYIIKDFSGKSYLEEHETFSVTGQKEYIREFATQDLPPGKYVLGIELVYPGAFATSSVQFEVSSTARRPLPWLIGFFVLVAICFIGVLFWAIRGRFRLYKP
jgi:hypothetical protein